MPSLKKHALTLAVSSVFETRPERALKKQSSYSTDGSDPWKPGVIPTRGTLMTFGVKGDKTAYGEYFAVQRPTARGGKVPENG